MRRKDREVKDFSEIIAILERCSVLHLAMISEGQPYSVPVNFGYVLGDADGAQKLTVYFHGAGEGTKITALKENPAVCFSAVASAETGAIGDSGNPCNWSCYYESVIGAGKVTFLKSSDSAERTLAMDSLMRHCGYTLPAGVKTIAYNAMALARTAVGKIEVTEITGKRHAKK